MFPQYFIEHPTEVRDVYIGPGSYVWAALVGPLYALRVAGLRAGLIAAGPTLLALAALAITFAATMYVSKTTQFILLGTGIVFVAVYQSRKVVQVVRAAYIRLGWTVHEI